MTQQYSRYKAIIQGKTYTFTNVENKEHMDIVTDTFNDQLNEVISHMPNATKDQVYLMVAFNALSDQVKKEVRLKSLEAELSEVKENLTALEEALTETKASEEKLMKRLEKLNQIEEQARKAIEANGDTATLDATNPIEAQRIVNQQMKEKIQKNRQSKV